MSDSKKTSSKSSSSKSRKTSGGARFGKPAAGPLPPSGLAEDILGRSEELASPERLYAFADSLGPQGPDSEEAKEVPETHVTFVLAAESFTLPVVHVQEVVRVNSITRVPHAPFPVRGITTLRGQILPVVDLRLRLGLPPVPTDSRSRILVLQSRGRRIGLLVDQVREVVRLLPSQIQPPPGDVMTDQSEYIQGVYARDDGLLILLDLDEVLLIPDSLEAAAQAAPRQGGRPAQESPP